MNVKLKQHPTSESLQAFGMGKLDDGSADSVALHLETCVECRQQVAALSGDSLLHRLQGARRLVGTTPPAESMADPSSSSPPQTAASADVSGLPSELANNPQYEVLQELGRGGMGTVYLARNKLMDRLEVLKVVNKSLIDRPGAMERFLREIQTAAKLQHENVVGAYSALQTGDVLAFAMEYVEGQDLSQVVKTQGPLPVANACHYARQAALGLQHAHEKGMIHRDIKPQNLILARAGKKHTVKILDFGLAKATREKKLDTGLTGEGALLGTPDYIAPEQTLDAATADIRADIYSLGCSLYYLLTGKPPFQASNLLDLLQAHQSVEATRLSEVRSEVPVELAVVVAKMMAKDPAKRFQTPSEVAQALYPFLKPGKGERPAVEESAKPCLAETTANPKNVVQSSAVKVRPNEESVPAFAFASKAMPADPKPKNGRRIKAASRNRLPLWIGGGVALGLLFVGVILLASGILRVQTPQGMIVLEHLPAGADVYVDGSQLKVKTPGADEPIEIRTKPGSHKLEIRKGGFKVFSQDVTLDAGGRRFISVRLEPAAPLMAKTPSPLKEPASETTRPTATPIPVPSDANRLEMTNSIGMKLVSIPPGKFLMGSPADEKQRNNDEVQHEVEITKGFWLGKYEVTQEEYVKVMGTNPSNFKGPKLPVDNVSWHEAKEFCGKLSAREGKQYTLPTDAEWEYACRAGTKEPFSTGDNLTTAQANYDGNRPYAGHAKGEFRGKSMEVGSFAANGYGLCDMHGNVWEWCEDWHGAYDTKVTTSRDPKGPSVARYRVLRGGGWSDDARQCRSAFRDTGDPPNRRINLGFRIVLRTSAPNPIPPEAKQPPPAPKVMPLPEMANSIGMKLVSIPAGKLLMGSPADEKERGDEPQHEVEITKGFWLGKYEVTQEEYEKVMGTNPSGFKGPKLPVECVSWHDAKEFCKTLSVKERKVYTLPTEAEWEYACRAGTKGPFSTGENLTTAQANYNGNVPYAGNAKGALRSKTTDVESFAANGYGLCEMHGNVWEWCEDWHGAYETKGVAVDPKGPSEGSSRVIRGGCWHGVAWHCRSANRDGYEPSLGNNTLGFRVVLRSVTPNPIPPEKKR